MSKTRFKSSESETLTQALSNYQILSLAWAWEPYTNLEEDNELKSELMDKNVCETVLVTPGL